MTGYSPFGPDEGGGGRDRDEVQRPILDFDDSDTDGHLVLPERGLLLNRYEVEDVIGCGTYGQVWKVMDLTANLPRAMKVSLRERRMDPTKTADPLTLSIREVTILRELNSINEDKKGLIVQLVDWFEIAERVFIIMELLGLCVFDFLDLNHNQPFRPHQARDISHQLLCAVDFLHQHNFMHTDIKPENIVFVCGEYEEIPNPAYLEVEEREDSDPDASISAKPKRRVHRALKILKRTEIRLVDFGSAIRLDDRTIRRQGKIGTREYRSPESILQHWFNLPADIWSIGCTLFDIWLGFTIMAGVKNDVQQLLRMETVFGPMTPRLMELAPPTFVEAREKCLQEGSRGWDKAGDPIPPEWVDPLPTRLFNYFNQDEELEMEAFKLIQSLLQYEVTARLTAAEALKHPLFKSLSPQIS